MERTSCCFSRNKKTKSNDNCRHSHKRNKQNWVRTVQWLECIFFFTRREFSEKNIFSSASCNKELIVLQMEINVSTYTIEMFKRIEVFSIFCFYLFASLNCIDENVTIWNEFLIHLYVIDKRKLKYISWIWSELISSWSHWIKCKQFFSSEFHPVKSLSTATYSESFFWFSGISAS